MNKPYWYFFLILALLGCAGAETHISGDIDGVAFTPKDNPYIVEKDIIVPEGKKVEIPAGCVFLFNAFAGLIVKGDVIVRGTGNQPVVFSSIHDSEYNPASSQLPNPFDWNGILITNTSVGSYLNDFSLRYSVYGVKSQSRNVVIQNGLFRQNGQFHFTVHDKIQFVQDNIPFSYGVEAGVDEAVGEQAGGRSRERKAKKQRSEGGSISKQTKIVRFACLGIGVAGAGLGTYFTVRAHDHTQRLDEIERNIAAGITTHSSEQFDAEDRKRIQSTVGAAVSYSIGVLGLIGFGVSFAF